ncbi:MAG: VacJ family lipoprotein [Pseudomonadota bacterium]
MKTLSAMLATVFLAVTLFAVATPSAHASDDVYDPFETFNRKVQKFNDAGDKYVISPAARAYRKVTPSLFRAGVRNFLSNLAYPVTIVNQFLQGKVRLGMQDTGRFLLNTTAGIGGLVDVASTVGLEHHDEDFGQTFATWGVPRGPYIVLPIWGGVSLREGIGDIPDTLVYPPTHFATQTESVVLGVLWALSRRDELTGAEQLVTGDRYLFIRDAYLQQRDYLIADGEIDDPFLD